MPDAASLSLTADRPVDWARLAVAVALSAVGGVGMWSVVVALPALQAEFGSARGGASLPFTLAMIGFAFGGVLMGRLADRFGIVAPLLLGAALLALGYFAASRAQNLTQVALAHGLLIGVGSSASFGPLIAQVSQWFVRRRGIAVGLCASGNYLAGVVWPPLVEHGVATIGWRATHVAIALVCAFAMPMLAAALVYRLKAAPAAAIAVAPPGAGDLRLPPGALQALLCLAGVGCCVAMAMPQVHIVAYCGDLGFGPARGAQMLSLMLGCGIVSRIASGFIADRFGGLPTLLLGSALQGLSLLAYMAVDTLTALFIVSALFGLFQGGIVPSYAIIIREYFPAKEAGARVGLVVMATLIGMAFGGWISGAIYDLTGSYRAAFANGLAWNLVNGAVVVWLLVRRRGGMKLRPRPA